MLTDFLLKFPSLTSVLRGPFVNQTVRADAEFTFAGIKFYVELDTGESSYTKIQAHWARYASLPTDDDHPHFLLVVTSSERRLQGLLQHSQRVADIALFAVLDEALLKPLDPIWADCSGSRIAFPGIEKLLAANAGGSGGSSG